MPNPIIGSASCQLLDGHSTSTRVHLPQPFGSFKVGEYRSGNTLSGSVVVSGQSQLIQDADVSLAVGGVVVSGQSQLIQDADVSLAVGGVVVSGQSQIKQFDGECLAEGLVVTLHSFDFSNAKLPSLPPLVASFEENTVEADLRQLFIDLFKANLSKDAFDANVLGAAHLGSMALVQKSVNLDGLVLLQGDREEAATRYLYRAWKSGDVQGRGLHFLRTYLQMLFPGLCEVNQLWHEKSRPYPHGLFSGKPRVNYWLYGLGEPSLKLNAQWHVGGQRPAVDLDSESSRSIDLSDAFLTSRVEIALDFSVNAPSIANLMQIIRSVIPARFVPIFRFMLGFVLHVQAQLSAQLLMEKQSRMRYPWCGRVIGDSDDVRWPMGRDGALVKLPQGFGAFRLGELRGGLSAWRLKGCRIGSSADMKSTASASVYRLPKLAETGRRLDATWCLGGRSADADSFAIMVKSSQITASQSLLTTQHDHVRMDYPGTPAKLGGRAQLSSWRRLDGRWGVGSMSSLRPFGFRVRRDAAIGIDSVATLQSTCNAYASPEKLAYPVATVLAPVLRQLDGGWALGAENKIGQFSLDGRRLRARHLTLSPRLGKFRLAHEYPCVTYERASARSLRLNGAWGVGSPAAPAFLFRAEKV